MLFLLFCFVFFIPVVFFYLYKIARKQDDLKKKLKVTFVGEPGLDMGGLTKEWFLLLIRQIFDPDYGKMILNCIPMKVKF